MICVFVTSFKTGQINSNQVWETKIEFFVAKCKTFCGFSVDFFLLIGAVMLSDVDSETEPKDVKRVYARFSNISI